MPTGAGGKPECQLMAVIEGHGFDFTDDFKDMLICCHTLLDGGFVTYDHFRGYILNEEDTPSKPFEDFTQLSGLQGMRRTLSTGPVVKTSRDLALEGDSFVNGNILNRNNRSPGCPELEGFITIPAKVILKSSFIAV